MLFPLGSRIFRLLLASWLSVCGSSHCFSHPSPSRERQKEAEWEEEASLDEPLLEGPRCVALRWPERGPGEGAGWRYGPSAHAAGFCRTKPGHFQALGPGPGPCSLGGLLVRLKPDVTNTGRGGGEGLHICASSLPESARPAQRGLCRAGI